MGVLPICSSAHESSGSNKGQKELRLFFYTLRCNLLTILLNGGMILSYFQLVEHLGHKPYFILPIGFCLFMPMLIQIGFALWFLIMQLFSCVLTSGAGGGTEQLPPTSLMQENNNGPSHLKRPLLQAPSSRSGYEEFTSHDWDYRYE